MRLGCVHRFENKDEYHGGENGIGLQRFQDKPRKGTNEN